MAACKQQGLALDSPVIGSHEEGDTGGVVGCIGGNKRQEIVDVLPAGEQQGDKHEFQNKEAGCAIHFDVEEGGSTPSSHS